MNVSSGIRATADRIQVNGEGHAVFRKSSTNRLRSGDNGWAVHSNQIKIDVEENALALRGLNIRIKDFPVMYLLTSKYPRTSQQPILMKSRRGLCFLISGMKTR